MRSHQVHHSRSVSAPRLQGQNANNSSNNDADNIKVVVRVRPLFPHEEAKGAASVVDVAEDYSSVKVGRGSMSRSNGLGSRAAAGAGAAVVQQQHWEQGQQQELEQQLCSSIKEGQFQEPQQLLHTQPKPAAAMLHVACADGWR
jgi:hypothetical protein